MAWLRLTITTDAAQAQHAAELLAQFAAVAISFHPATDEALFEEAADREALWQKTQVSALLDSEIELDILLACLRNRIGTENILSHQIAPVADEDWTQAHKAGHGPRVFAERLCICPSWSAPPADGLTTVVLDPGLAFGSGGHASTALCLDWLARQELADRTVIDYGCGSGILALAAAALGAGRVYATDIDPQALSASAENARRNDLQKKIQFSLAAKGAVPAADILLANILLGPLLELAPQLAALVKTGGALALSGILAVQAQECQAAYAPWFTLDAPTYQDEWALLVGIRKGHC